MPTPDAPSARAPGSGVRVHRAGAVEHVTLDRPPVNALGAATYATLATAFAPTPGVRVRVLRGEGRVFSAGQDTAEAAALDRGEGGPYLAAAGEALAAVARSAVPLVAVVGGPAVGAGALLVALADVVVLSEDAWLAFPEARYGLALGLSVLADVLPVRLARSLLATGCPVTAAQLAGLGAADRVVPRAVLHEAAAEEVSRLLALPAPMAAWLYDGPDRAARAAAWLEEVTAAVAAGTWPLPS